MNKFQLSALSFWLLTAAGVTAHAQSPGAPTGAVLDYPQSFFADAQMNTVYDMVGRLPGFVFSDNSSSTRGFSGNAGNVLVDGQRPTSKTDDLQSVLQRIPADRVARIEVIRGNAPGIDMQGQAVVANVILKKSDTTQVIATLTDTIYGDGHQGPGGNIELNHRTGDTVYDVTLSRINSINNDGAGNGQRYLYVPGQPVLVDNAHERGSERTGYGINASLATPVLGGDFAGNLTLRETTYNSAVFYDAPDPANYPSSYRVRSGEFGANWDRHFGAADLNIVALQRLERDQNTNASISPTTHQTFESISDTNESILRSTLRYVPSEKLMLESGLEGDYNTLKGNSSFVSNGVAVTLPAANPHVGEKRGEVFAQSSWAFAPGWSLESGARFEFSTIGAQGIASRSFDFLKPRALLSWSFNSASQLRLRAERVVGQLDFTNFIASSDLAGVGVSGGNLYLRPDQRWQFEGDYEYHFWDKGALVLSYTREDITDLVDRVPIGGGLDAPGNIHKATNNIYDIEASLPLDRLGLENGTLKPSLVWKDGAVRDPVTGQIRQISGTQDRLLVVHLFQDIQSLNSTWNLTLQSAFQRPNFSIAQVSYFRLHPLYVSFSWDYRARPDLDLQLGVYNAVPYQSDSLQYNYAGPRNVSPLSSYQLVHTHAEARVFLQLRKTF